MAQAAANAKNDAQTAYFFAKRLLDDRVNPPGGGQHNLRRLKRATQDAELAWNQYEHAQYVWMNRHDFAEGQCNVEVDRFAGVKIGYHDDIEDAKEIVERLEAADGPQAAPVLTAAQKLERLVGDIASRENMLNTRADGMKTSLDDVATRFTLAMLTDYDIRCETLDGDLNGLQMLYQE